MGSLTLGSSSLPWSSRLVQVGEQLGRTSMGTAAGPPALGFGLSPLTLGWLCQKLIGTSLFPQGLCVGSEEWAGQPPAPEQEDSVIGKIPSARTCLY